MPAEIMNSGRRGRQRRLISPPKICPMPIAAEVNPTYARPVDVPGDDRPQHLDWSVDGEEEQGDPDHHHPEPGVTGELPPPGHQVAKKPAGRRAAAPPPPFSPPPAASSPASALPGPAGPAPCSARRPRNASGRRRSRNHALTR